MQNFTKNNLFVSDIHVRPVLLIDTVKSSGFWA